MTPSSLAARCALALLALTGCPRNDGTQGAGRGGEQRQLDPVRDEYVAAERLARGGSREGYRRLLAVARDGHSAEWSEVAQDRLLHLLYEDPALWLKGVSPLDGPELRAYLGKIGLYPNDLPPAVASHLDFERRCSDKLRSAGANEKERDLATFIVRFYEEDLAKSK